MHCFWQVHTLAIELLLQQLVSCSVVDSRTHHQKVTLRDTIAAARDYCAININMQRLPSSTRCAIFIHCHSDNSC